MPALCGIIQRILYIKWQMHYFYPQEAAIGISLQMPHLTLTEMFYFRHHREEQSTQGLEGTTLSQGPKEMVVEKRMKNVGNHIHEKRQAEQMTKIAVVSLGRI